MWLVLASMRRPIAILVAVISVAFASVLALRRMNVDIFPPLGAPAIYVAQPYGGMAPAQMEGFLTYYYEYHFLFISGLEHVESKNVQGMALMKLVFHPATDMSQATADVIGYVNRSRAFMPPGAVPPFIMRYDAGSVPIAQLVFSSPSRTVGEMQDIALNRVRPIFATLPGVSAPPPFGGSQRTIANFQSFRLAFAVVLTTPAVVCGVLLMLLFTGTTLNVQSFMGAIMALGIAVANAILLVTFAEMGRQEGKPILEAALEGGRERLRAILMTAMAMIAGMIPIALGIGEGAEQTAPLGRAVIGGLLAATLATLLVLPSVYVILQGHASKFSPSLDPKDPSSRHYGVG